VGSEMCIRDSIWAAFVDVHPGCRLAAAPPGALLGLFCSRLCRMRDNAVRDNSRSFDYRRANQRLGES